MFLVHHVISQTPLSPNTIPLSPQNIPMIVMAFILDLMVPIVNRALRCQENKKYLSCIGVFLDWILPVRSSKDSHLSLVQVISYCPRQMRLLSGILAKLFTSTLQLPLLVGMFAAVCIDCQTNDFLRAHSGTKEAKFSNRKNVTSRGERPLWIRPSFPQETISIYFERILHKRG